MELRGVWDAISNPWSSPMQSHDWVRTWAEVYGIDQDLEILLGERRPAVAIAPLVRSRRGGQRLELVGPEELGEVMDFLYSDPSSVAGLATALAASGLPLRFWRVPADSPVVAAVSDAYRWRGIVRHRSTAGVPSLPLDESWVNPEQHLDAHRRSNVRRARRIAESMGPLTWEILSPKPDEVGPLLDDAYAVETAGWKARHGTPLASDRLVGQFFRRYAAAAAERGVLRLGFLRIDGRTAAMKLAAIAGNRFWLLAMGFSDEFERCSPGTLLLLETIRYAAQSGLRSYEFLGAKEPWIRPWTHIVRPCVSLRTYPFNPAGVVALASDAGAAIRARGTAITAAARRLPSALVQRTARAYMAGQELEDAMRACRSLSARGFRSTIGYFNPESEPPRSVADQYAAAIDAIGGGGFDCYASVKATALRFSRDLVRGIAERAHRRDVDLHFDSLAADTVEETFSLIRDLRTVHPDIGCTLPGRWQRNVADADRAIDLDLGVRVIKGEYVEAPGREVDPLAGFLAIVDRIAGRVRHAAVATHNPVLAREAFKRLRAAGTQCELEVLLGYPVHRVIPIAQAESIPVRFYVPFGELGVPYALWRVKQNPRIAWWVLRDLLRGGMWGPPEMRSHAPRTPPSTRGRTRTPVTSEVRA